MQGQQGRVQQVLGLVWVKPLKRRPQDVLLTACRVAEAQAAGRGIVREGMVELVVEVGSRGELLGVVEVAHVRIINQALARLHQGAHAVGVAEGGRGMRTDLLLGG